MMPSKMISRFDLACHFLSELQNSVTIFELHKCTLNLLELKVGYDVPSSRVSQSQRTTGFRPLQYWNVYQHRPAAVQLNFPLTFCGCDMHRMCMDCASLVPPNFTADSPLFLRCGTGRVVLRCPSVSPSRRIPLVPRGGTVHKGANRRRPR